VNRIRSYLASDDLDRYTPAQQARGLDKLSADLQSMPAALRRRSELDFARIDAAEDELVQGGQGRTPEDLEGDGRVVAISFSLVLLIVAWVALTTFSRPVLYGIGATITAVAVCFVVAYVARGMR
jgi:hypothetical protein